MNNIINNNSFLPINENNKITRQQTMENKINYLIHEQIKTNTDRLTNKKINIVTAFNTEEFSSEIVGGKAATLYRMQKGGIVVPEFTTIDVNSIASLELYDLDITSLQPFIANIINFDLSAVNIASVKQEIQKRYSKTAKKRNLHLQGLANFIISDAFYNQIKNSPTAKIIRENYHKLIVGLPKSSAIIVRSSGITEDNYGDAQAGKYESIIHAKQDILCTCLQVIASGYQPHIYQYSTSQPMALIIQRYIDCSFGGVAMSRLSQNDNRCKIEYVQGQPKGGVSGLVGVTPHSYLVSLQEDKFIAEFTPGNITTKFILNQKSQSEFIENQVAANEVSTNVKLNEKQLNQLYQYMKLGEDMLLCPADIEFAISQDGSLYIVQLRPLTVLIGGVNYDIKPPVNYIATGTLVSEGFCSGKIRYLTNKQDAQTVVQGDIVITEHCAEWMLDNEFIQRVSGFIFHQGGTNDHVAITLRQQEKPCLIVKNKFAEIKNSNNIISVACCSFNNKSSAYVTCGSEFAEKLATIKPTITTNFFSKPSSVIIRETLKLKFDKPDIAFKNLNDLNYKLLEYFNVDSWLSRCFSKKGILLLSMSPNRIDIIKEARKEIELLFFDFKLFLSGYKQYLQLGMPNTNNTTSLVTKLHMVEVLINNFADIKSQIYNNINYINQQFIGIANKKINIGDFKEVLKQAKSIFRLTQSLNAQGNNIKSIHDCIFWIHRSFIDALADVAINSGYGTIHKYKNINSILFSNTKKQKSIEKSCLTALEQLEFADTPSVIIMENTIIATAQLGIHVFNIEMLKQEKSAKKLTLKLKLSDNFVTTNHYQGKLKRFWFLTQFLYNIGFDKNAARMTASVDECSGILTIEISQIKNQKIMLNKFSTLIAVLNAMDNKDIKLENMLDSKNKWNFSILKQKISSLDSLENQQYFNHVFIFLGAIIYPTDPLHKITINFKYISKIIKKLQYYETTNYQEIQNLLDNININQEKLLYELLFTGIKPIIKLAKIKYPNWFNDKNMMLKLILTDEDIINYVSEELKQDKKFISDAIKINKYVTIHLAVGNA